MIMIRHHFIRKSKNIIINQGNSQNYVSNSFLRIVFLAINCHFFLKGDLKDLFFSAVALAWGKVCICFEKLSDFDC